MLLLIAKNEGKPHIVRYKRDDGTGTWMKADKYFAKQDIYHYSPKRHWDIKQLLWKC